jgi:hypothetical protein
MHRHWLPLISGKTSARTGGDGGVDPARRADNARSRPVRPASGAKLYTTGGTLSVVRKLNAEPTASSQLEMTKSFLAIGINWPTRRLVYGCIGGLCNVERRGNACKDSDDGLNW